MLNGLKNIIAQVVYTPTNTVTSVQKSAEYNPFVENPFIKPVAKNNYAINKPVKGGYFAGYYNGKQNIVGRKLFIEA